MATIRDVAARAGVSVATVSRVLNENGYVNKETEQRVRRAIQELNYRPNMVARGLANRKTGTIAVILPDIKNPFFSELARAVEDTARAGGFTVIFCNCDDLGPRQKSYIEVLRQKYIDGIIIASNTLGKRMCLHQRQRHSAGGAGPRAGSRGLRRVPGQKRRRSENGRPAPPGCGLPKGGAHRRSRRIGHCPGTAEGISRSCGSVSLV